MSASPKYLLRKAVLASVPEIEITASEYDDLTAARIVLSYALAIEEKYEILISNFLELEETLLHTALTDSVRDVRTYSEMFEVRSALNARLVNLLSAARLYLDQLPQDAKHCLPDGVDVKSLIQKQCSSEYDNHFEYRFMEALRNHVQHRGIPVHLTEYHSEWKSTDVDPYIEFSVRISASRTDLEKAGKFTKKILDEMGEQVNLVVATRRYVESLSTIHDYTRKIIEDTVNSARTAIESARRRYALVYSDSLTGLCASASDETQEISSVSLMLDWDDVRIEQQERNRKLVNLSKRTVVSRTQA